MKSKGKRLGQEKWLEIKILLRKKDRNISQIAKKYGVARKTIYQYAWSRGWLDKEEKPQITFWGQIKAYFKPK